MTERTGEKRINLHIPDKMWVELQAVVDKKGATAADFIRESAKLGIRVENGGTLIKIEGDKKTELIII